MSGDDAKTVVCCNSACGKELAEDKAAWTLNEGEGLRHFCNECLISYIIRISIGS